MHQYIGKNLILGGNRNITFYGDDPTTSDSPGFRKASSWGDDVNWHWRNVIDIDDAFLNDQGILQGVNIHKSHDNNESQVDICQDGISIEKGKHYTVSCYARGKGQLDIQVCHRDTPAGPTIIDDVNFTDEGKDYPKKLTSIDHDDWKRYSYTVVALGNYLSVYFGISRFDNGDIDVCGFKLEEGNTVTPYVPALEDGEIEFIEKNLIPETSSVWSEWKTVLTWGGVPAYNASINLAEQVEGDWNGQFTVTFEMEFADASVDYMQTLQDGWEDLGLTAAQVIFRMEKEDGTVSFFSDRTKNNIYYPWDENDPPQNRVHRCAYHFDLTYSYKYLTIYLRTDFWLAGRMRFRKVAVKKGHLTNVLWCK